MLLDLLDKKLLYYLSKNGRLSYSSLAKNLMVSRETVKARINKLVEEKVILSFPSIYNHPYVGLDLYNFYINFSRMDSQKQNAFEKYIQMHPSIIWGYRCMGNWDYALILLVKNTADLSWILDGFKQRFKDFSRTLILM